MHDFSDIMHSSKVSFLRLWSESKKELTIENTKGLNNYFGGHRTLIVL